MTLFKKGVILVVVLLLVQLGFGAALVTLHGRVEKEAREMEASFKVTDLLMTSFFALTNIQTKLNYGHLDLDAIESAFVDLQKTIVELQKAFRNEPDRKAIIDAQNNDTIACLSIIRNAKRLKDSGTFKIRQNPEFWNPLNNEMTSWAGLAGKLNQMIVQEQAKTKQSLADEESDRHSIFLITSSMILLELALIAAGVLWFNWDVTRRMRSLVENTRRISSHRVLLGGMSGDDEITKLNGLIHEIALAVTTAEKNDRDLIDQQKDLIICLNERLEIITANRVCHEEFGLGAEQSQNTTSTIFNIVHEEDMALIEQQFKAAAADGQAQFEASIFNRDKATVHALWHVRWSRSEETFFCVLHDITAHKKAETLRQEVLQMVGHDLKTPLNTVSGFLELFEAKVVGTVSAEGQELVDKAVADADRMSTVIKDLLRLETIRAGMAPLQFEHLNLGGLIERTLQSLDPTFKKREVSVLVKECNFELFADEAALSETLKIVLTNATSRIAVRGQNSIAIDCKSRGEELLITVSDWGQTIPSHELAHLFEPFRTGAYGGSRLSLALCQANIELHGGRISCTSSAENGTTFTISLLAKTG